MNRKKTTPPEGAEELVEQIHHRRRLSLKFWLIGALALLVAAGILTIAVNAGPLPDSALTDLGADLLYPSMTLLAGGIDAILSQGA